MIFYDNDGNNEAAFKNVDINFFSEFGKNGGQSDCTNRHGLFLCTGKMYNVFYYVQVI